MRLLFKRKDGGGESTVTGYWLIEAKSLFSVCLLRFDGKSREAFHNHAFNCFSWVIRGELMEQMLDGRTHFHEQSWRPFITSRRDMHKVSSITAKPSWVLSFRGPWSRSWTEWRPLEGRYVSLTSGRKEI
jgi:hypothetical protein